MTRILDLMPTFGVTSSPMRRALDRFFNGWMEPYGWIEEPTEWTPASEITGREKHYVVTVELPGVDMKSLDISYKEGLLTVKGEKKDVLEENECCYCSERYHGSFSRSFQIPGKIKEDDIDATLKDGILKVVLSKSDESVAKKIEIH